MQSTGGQPVSITPAGDQVGAPDWSPDSRWIAYQRGLEGKRELVKIDSAGQGQPVALSQLPIRGNINFFTRWSAAGPIAYLARDGVRVCGQDGSSDHLLAPGAVAGDFNCRGDLFYGLKLEAEQWKLMAVEVASGRVLRIVAVEESPRAGIRTVSLHPDGKRLAYSRNEFNYDIWLLDGIPRPATGWMKLFRHWTES